MCATNAVPCGSDIAIALHTPPHRTVSLGLLAQSLGASQGKGRLRRSVTALSKGSFSLPKIRVRRLRGSSANLHTTTSGVVLSGPYDSALTH